MGDRGHFSRSSRGKRRIDSSDDDAAPSPASPAHPTAAARAEAQDFLDAMRRLNIINGKCNQRA